MRLAEKVILITGSTTGIGEAMARRFVAEGARVVVHGTRRNAGEELVASLGAQAAFCQGDLSDPKTPAELIKFTVSTFGRIDGLVNNAAVMTRANIETTTAEIFDKIVAVNLRAPMLLIQAALPHLKRSQGAVLNIGPSTATAANRISCPTASRRAAS